MPSTSTPIGSGIIRRVSWSPERRADPELDMISPSIKLDRDKRRLSGARSWTSVGAGWAAGATGSGCTTCISADSPHRSSGHGVVPVRSGDMGS
jgi:hypothetical protein